MENDKKREGWGSWESEGKRLGTTYCCQRGERRQDGVEKEGTTKTCCEEGEGERGGKGDIRINPCKGRGSSFF